MDSFCTWRILFPVVTVLLVAGCARHPRELQEYAAAYGHNSSGLTQADNGFSANNWWNVFDDAELAKLIAQGLANNYSLRGAWYRLEQSGYALRALRATRYPQLTVQGFGGQERRILRDGGTESGDVWGVSAALSYELDLWRRLSASVAGAESFFEASTTDYEVLAISMAAAICDAWFDLQERSATLVLLQTQYETAQQALQAVERRFQEGLGELLDVYQQRELVSGLMALLPAAEAAVELSRERLGVLLGVAPDALALAVDGRLPDPVVMPDGVDWSVQVLARPDVRSAWLRLQAAEQERIAAARTRFPVIRLTGQASTREERPGDLFDEVGGDALVQVGMPLFDGGRLRAEANRVDAVANERLQSFREVELQALREMREAALQDRAQAETVLRLGKELEAARQTLALSRERYRSGLVEYLNVLAAQQRVHQLERGLLRAQRQRLVYQVQFMRATAGAGSE